MFCFLISSLAGFWSWQTLKSQKTLPKNDSHLCCHQNLPQQWALGFRKIIPQLLSMISNTLMFSRKQRTRCYSQKIYQTEKSSTPQTRLNHRQPPLCRTRIDSDSSWCRASWQQHTLLNYKSILDVGMQCFLLADPLDINLHLPLLLRASHPSMYTKYT